MPSTACPESSFSLDSVARDPRELWRFLTQNLSLPNGTAEALLAARVDLPEVRGYWDAVFVCGAGRASETHLSPHPGASLAVWLFAYPGHRVGPLQGSGTLGPPRQRPPIPDGGEGGLSRRWVRNGPGILPSFWGWPGAEAGWGVPGRAVVPGEARGSAGLGPFPALPPPHTLTRSCCWRLHSWSS